MSASAVTIAPEDIRRLSVAQYHAMIESGILTVDDPVELLTGWLVTKMPKNPKHRLVTQLTREALAAAVPDGWYVDAQEPITTADSEPEPDVAVVRGRRRDYADRHPGAHDVALVVEVADSSLQRDRTVKQRLYAAAGIAEFWIIDLLQDSVEQYQQPINAGSESLYGAKHTFARGDQIRLLLDTQPLLISVDALLPDDKPSST